MYSVSEHIPGAVLVGEVGLGEAIIVLPGRGLHLVNYDGLAEIDELDDLDPDDVAFIAPDLETLLCSATILRRLAGSPRHPWREIRRWRKLNNANARSARIYLRQAAVFSVAAVVLGTAHYGWVGFLVAVVAAIVVHRAAQIETGGEGPVEIGIGVVVFLVIALFWLAVAALVLGILGWLYWHFLLSG